MQVWFYINAGFDKNSKDALADNIQTLSTRFAGVRSDGINALEASVSKNWMIKEKDSVCNSAARNRTHSTIRCLPRPTRLLPARLSAP